MHTNFSNDEMRNRGTLHLHQTICEKLKAKHQVLIIESIDKLPENISIENCNCEILDDHTLQVFQGESTSISDVVLALSTQNINVSHLRSAQNRLEALFISLTN